MSRKRALAALRGETTDRVPLIELAAHPDFMKQITGADPYEKTAEVFADYLTRMDMDASILGCLPTPRTKDESVEQDEHHVYTQWGLRDTPWLTKPLYATMDEVLGFDPRKHDRSSPQEKVDRYCRDYETAQRLFGESVQYMPGHYQLVLHYVPFYCDWAVFLEALILQPERCRGLFDRCAEYSLEVFEALAQTPAPAIIAHEDLCSARGPIYPPHILRKEIFPRFAEIFSPVKKAGKRILAFGEGKIEEIAADLLEAGADGVFVDQNNNLEAMVELVGRQGLIVAGIDTLTLTNGSPDQIRRKIAQRMAVAKRIPGFFFCVTGETPQNVPVENLQTYFDACREYGSFDISVP
jgi:uroporphyrinogen-III decarboxylase